ncbi:MAG: hypothetical protein IPO08_16580 [Xanthomonadales bacterium]|nr:hypothetical protein [Xanthomonadales bacterium]
MSDNYFDPDWREAVSLPVKWTGERWQYFFGDSIPIKPGTLAELRLCAEQITDLEFRRRVTRKLRVQVLPEGAPLLVALSDRSYAGDPKSFPQPRPIAVPLGTTRFVEVRLGPKGPSPASKESGEALEAGGLFLKLKGDERRELSAASVLMPEGMSPAQACSLNHAFTLLSQAYEKHRISNTGNIYSRVFYQDGDGAWYPLNDLRAATGDLAKRTVLKALNTAVESAALEAQRLISGHVG